MTFKSIFRELREIGKKSRSRSGGQQHTHCRGRSHIAPEQYSPSSSALVEQGQWANLPPELLIDIIQRVEAIESSWPARRDVVACASVCKSWREITKEILRTPEQCGCLTFPISLKQPGPRDFPIQCFIKRERGTSTYRLYLGLGPGDTSKLLLSARKIRRATGTDFVISLAADDFSRASNNYVGKLRSNFLGTKFRIYDSQPPYDPTTQSEHQPHHRVHLKQVSPRVPAGNYNVATISYELNVLRTRGPRRMQCNMHSIPISSIQDGGTAYTPTAFLNSLDDEQFLKGKKTPSLQQNGKSPRIEFSSTSLAESVDPSVHATEVLVMKNKAPRWHEQLQCWCLNFKGRVTVASVKNFQLVATAEPTQNISPAEQEKVMLQFGKIGKDIFTMDYRYPLSAFQAFAVCLTSFDTKPACE